MTATLTKAIKTTVMSQGQPSTLNSLKNPEPSNPVLVVLHPEGPSFRRAKAAARPNRLPRHSEDKRSGGRFAAERYTLGSSQSFTFRV